MAAPHSVDPAAMLEQHLQGASPDVLREMIATLANAMMSAQADQVCGAGYGERSEDRTNQRNGYRAREWDTRAGTVELAIPKLRQGSFYPDWLLTHRRRAEQALVTVVATIAMGFWSAGKSKTAGDFFVAGRSVSVGWNAFSGTVIGGVMKWPRIAMWRASTPPTVMAVWRSIGVESFMPTPWYVWAAICSRAKANLRTSCSVLRAAIWFSKAWAAVGFGSV